MRDHSGTSSPMVSIVNVVILLIDSCLTSTLLHLVSQTPGNTNHREGTVLWGLYRVFLCEKCMLNSSTGHPSQHQWRQRNFKKVHLFSSVIVRCSRTLLPLFHPRMVDDSGIFVTNSTLQQVKRNFGKLQMHCSEFHE